MDKVTQKKKPSVRSLAKATGLSVATISRVLNKSDSVHDKTRNRVLEAMREHGYIMNSAARALATNRTRTIGAVVPTLSHSIFARFLKAVEQRLAKQGYALVVASSGGIDAEEQRVRDLLDLGTEGLILSGAQHDKQLMSMIREREIPAIYTSIYDPSSSIPTIGYDNAAIAEQGIDYLYQHGHKAIHIVHGRVEGNDRTALRLEGIYRAAKKYRLDISCSEVTIDVAGGAKAATEFVNQRNEATACFCLSDILALGVLFEFNRRQISVPGDISVMGFDDLEWAGYSHPGLTTMGLPTTLMGDKTALAMIEYLDNKLPIQSERLRADVIERETVTDITKAP